MTFKFSLITQFIVRADIQRSLRNYSSSVQNILGLDIVHINVLILLFFFQDPSKDLKSLLKKQERPKNGTRTLLPNPLPSVMPVVSKNPLDMDEVVLD